MTKQEREAKRNSVTALKAEAVHHDAEADREYLIASCERLLNHADAAEKVIRRLIEWDGRLHKMDEWHAAVADAEKLLEGKP
jgi:hypothetical protein